MVCYKVFRVFKGGLYSAFEGWNDPSHLKRLRYQEGEVTSDPEPDKYSCPGLMIIQREERAHRFLDACGRTPYTPKKFALYEVHPIATIIQGGGGNYYAEGYVDSLRVGKKICERKV